MYGRYMARTKAVSAPGFAGEIEKAIRAGDGLSLLLVDLDNLMILNEKGGRALGDKAIAAVARTLAARASAEGWTLGRVGGDEFALAAPGLALEVAFLRAEGLRKDLVAAPRKSTPARLGTT